MLKQNGLNLGSTPCGSILWAFKDRPYAQKLTQYQLESAKRPKMAGFMKFQNP